MKIVFEFNVGGDGYRDGPQLVDGLIAMAQTAASTFGPIGDLEGACQKLLSLDAERTVDGRRTLLEARDGKEVSQVQQYPVIARVVIDAATFDTKGREITDETVAVRHDDIGAFVEQVREQGADALDNFRVLNQKEAQNEAPN